MAIGRVCGNRLVAAKGKKKDAYTSARISVLPSKQPFCNVDVSGVSSISLLQ